ncbi:MAG: MarR family transcriptional regulator [Candidatus Hodarchaeales archaeon]
MSDPNNKPQNGQISKLEENIMNFFEDLMYELRGGSPLFGRIFGLTILADEGETFLQKDLADRFNVSTSAISRNLKTLENWGLLGRRRRRQPDSREYMWEYTLEPTAFLDLFNYPIMQNLEVLKSKREELVRSYESWRDNIKPSDQGIVHRYNSIMSVLEFLIKWMEIVEEELNKSLSSLENRFWEIKEEK